MLSEDKKSAATSTSQAVHTGEPIRFGGVIAAMVTPCRQPGVVDFEEAGVLCRHLVDGGCDGIFVAGSSGESALLDDIDRRRLTVAARRSARLEAAIYVGVTGMGLKQTIRNARHAAEDGADVAVVTPPPLFKFGQAELAAYFGAIADASPLPVALYHHPRTPTRIEAQTIRSLARHPNVIAIKHTSTSTAETDSLARGLVGENLVVLQGNESLLRESFALGQCGGLVTSLAGIVPEWHADLFRALRAGNVERADELQQRITRLWRMFRLESVQSSFSAFIYALKAALVHRGWLESTDVMMAGFEPSQTLHEELFRHFDAAGLPRSSAWPAGDGRVRIDPPVTENLVSKNLIQESETEAV